MSEPAAAPAVKRKSGLGAMIAATPTHTETPESTPAPAADNAPSAPTPTSDNPRPARPRRAGAAAAAAPPPAAPQPVPVVAAPQSAAPEMPLEAPPATAAPREKISRGREGSRNRTIRLDDDEQRMVKEIEFFLYRAGSLRGRIGPTFVHRVLLRLGYAMLDGRDDELVNAAASIEDPES